jgi:hypothetical protein
MKWIVPLVLLCACKDKPAAPAPAPAPGPVLGPTAEVELSGQIKTPPEMPAGVIKVMVTDGECWKPETRMLGGNDAAPEGRFFSEVYVKQGTKLWLCAALVPQGQAAGAIEWTASAPKAPFLGQGAGEVEFMNIQMEMKKGPPVTLPVRAPR